jgi:hypothetical protein
MRTYLSTHNLLHASILGAAVTVLAIPRILVGGLSPLLFIPAAFLSMTLISGMATAWGKRAGMCGLFPERKRALQGIGVAVVLLLMLIPVCVLWLDRAIYDAARASGDSYFLKMLFPSTVAGALALVLWAIGFETMFFEVAAMSYFSRLVGRQWIAVVLSVVLRGVVTYARLAGVGATDSAWLFLGSVSVAAVIGCVLFARFGLPAAMVFSAGLAMRSFSL